MKNEQVISNIKSAERELKICLNATISEISIENFIKKRENVTWTLCDLYNKAKKIKPSRTFITESKMNKEQVNIKKQLEDKLDKHIRLEIKGENANRDQCGVVRQLRKNTFDFRIFGSNKKHIIRYDQILKISKP